MGAYPNTVTPEAVTPEFYIRVYEALVETMEKSSENGISEQNIDIEMIVIFLACVKISDSPAMNISKRNRADKIQEKFKSIYGAQILEWLATMSHREASKKIMARFGPQLQNDLNAEQFFKIMLEWFELPILEDTQIQKFFKTAEGKKLRANLMAMYNAILQEQLQREASSRGGRS